MKKILFGCVALTVLITAVAIVELNKTPKPVVSPAEQVLNKETDTAVVPINEEKVYSESEAQIQEAIENYLYFKNIDKVIKTDVKADGKDFIITLTNPSNPALAPQEMRLTRVDDFAGKPQYKLSNTSLSKWQALAGEQLENATLTVDSFNEDVLWVPELGLVTNQAVKVSNLQIKATDLALTLKSLVSDTLVQQQNDKMTIAASSDVTDFKAATSSLIVQAPRIIQNMQINGANQTGNALLQVLTAENATSTLSIPVLGVVFPTMPQQPIIAQLDSKAIFADNISLDTTLSNIKINNSLFPLVPETITSNVTLDGVSKEMLIAYINMRDQLQQLPDEDSVEAKDLSQKLLAAQNQILKSLSLKINKLSMSNPNAGIDITGIVHYADPAPTVNARLSITNFDVISPKAPPVNEATCKAALATTPAPVQGKAPIVPAACVQQGGLLEGLRPYLPTAEHSVNDKGQPVDTFAIVYSANSLTINNQPILTPGQAPVPGNDIALGTDTPVVVAVQNDATTPTAPVVQDSVSVESESIAAPSIADDTLQNMDVQPVDGTNTPSIADLMAEVADEPVGPQGNAEPIVINEEVAAIEEIIPARTDDIPAVSDTQANAQDVGSFDNMDNTGAEPTDDTPLEPVQDSIVPIADTPAVEAAVQPGLPTAPVVDSIQIVEAQKLLDETAAQ